jgi:cell division transport system permease protein
MGFKNLGYFFREAFISLSRNRALSLATVSTMAICILFLGTAVLMTINAGNFMNQLESDVEIVAFLDNTLNETQLEEIKISLEQLEGVKSVVFVSKEQALEKLQSKFAEENYDLEKTLGNNPLPATYEIKADNPQDVGSLAKNIEQISGIYRVNYGQGIVERLFQVTKWVRIISIGFIVLLIICAVFLIATTIRLSIFARRKEIYLMKLIGANDWFVRWPFFIEGIILGLVGALVSVGLLSLGYNALINNLQTALFFIPLVSQKYLLIKLYLSLLAAGAFLGLLGSYISLNRYLDV